MHELIRIMYKLIRIMNDRLIRIFQFQPENILLSSHKEPIVKLIDLGSAQDLSLHVTPASYGSPEFCGMITTL